jgi:hypothetical protein
MRLVVTKDQHGYKLDMYSWAVGGENHQTITYSDYTYDHPDIVAVGDSLYTNEFRVRDLDHIWDFIKSRWFPRYVMGGNTDLYFIGDGYMVCGNCGLKEIEDAIKPVLDEIVAIEALRSSNDEYFKSFSLEFDGLPESQYDDGDSSIFGGHSWTARTAMPSSSSIVTAGQETSSASTRASFPSSSASQTVRHSPERVSLSWSRRAGPRRLDWRPTSGRTTPTRPSAKRRGSTPIFVRPCRARRIHQVASRH